MPTEVDSNASNLRLTVFAVVIYHHESESGQRSYHSKGDDLQMSMRTGIRTPF